MSERHVVAVRLGKLGDLVMVVPALRWIAATSGLRLTLLVDEHHDALFRLLLPSLVVSTVPPVQPADLVLDLHRVHRSRALIRHLRIRAGAPRVRVRKEDISRRMLLASVPSVLRFGTRPIRSWPQRHLDAAERALHALGIAHHERAPKPGPLPRLSLPGLARSGATSPVLGLSPGAGWRSKRWPLTRLRQLARAWHGRTGGDVRVFVAPSEQDLGREILREEGTVLHPDPSLVGLARGLLACDVLVAGDTGPLHLAAALGRPVVALFGPTPVDAGFWAWGERGVLLRAAEPPACSPCSLHGGDRCAAGHHRCMIGISAERVLVMALSLLRPPAAAVG